jgi:hypothetical protein
MPGDLDTNVRSSLWIQKSVVLLLYKQMLSGLPRPALIINACWIVLFGTYVAVLVTCFSECRPLRLYWQVQPDPGKS